MVIDISQYNGVTLDSILKNCEQYKFKADELEGVIIRLGYRGYGAAATLSKDKLVIQNVNAAKTNGLPWGLYWLFQCVSVDEVYDDIQYIKNFTDAVGLPPMGVWIDYESAGRGSNGLPVDRWRNLTFPEIEGLIRQEYDLLKDEYKIAGVYCNADYWNNRMTHSHDLPVWIARYRTDLTEDKIVGMYGDTVFMWQYETTNGKLDKNKLINAAASQPPYRQLSRLLKVLCRGEDVKYLQQLLNNHGYVLANDGNFGKITKNAVMDFQEKQGLTKDGLVGPKTWKALNET